jgi:hypothetical protein
MRLEDRTRGDRHLATLCPADLGQPFKGLDIDPGQARHAYGLGQAFKRLGSADGDWTAPAGPGARSERCRAHAPWLDRAQALPTSQHGQGAEA